MKRILFLTPHVPNQNAGGANFTRLLLDDLSKDNLIDVIYFYYKGEILYRPSNNNIKVLLEIQNSLWLKLKNALTYPILHPLYTVRFSRGLLNFVINQCTKVKYDLVYLDHSQMFLYGTYLEGIKKILMSHDVMAQRYSRKGNLLNRIFIIQGEKKLLSQPDSTIFAFSNKDRDIISKSYGLKALVTRFFLDKDVVDACPSKIEKRIILFGKWNRPDNYEGLKFFLNKVYPFLKDDISIEIIGSGLHNSIQNRLVKLNNITYKGFVDNPYIVIANSLAVVCPLFSGAGVKVKVYESLACGTPVIGTSIAFEGIFNDLECYMFLANEAKEFINIINGFSVTLQERRTLKELFMNLYDNNSITKFISNM
jgi:glycosyltransferase involved in cell wall biosynthesis